MSPPPISVLTTAVIGPCRYPKILGQKGKNNH